MNGNPPNGLMEALDLVRDSMRDGPQRASAEERIEEILSQPSSSLGQGIAERQFQVEADTGITLMLVEGAMEHLKGLGYELRKFGGGFALDGRAGVITVKEDKALMGVAVFASPHGGQGTRQHANTYRHALIFIARIIAEHDGGEDS